MCRNFVFIFAVVLLAVCSVPFAKLSAQDVFSNYTTLVEEKWLPRQSIRTIFQDSRGLLWVGTANAGLYKYNLNEVENINFTQKISGKLLNNTIHALAEDAYGNIFVGTESGLGVINVATGEIKTLSGTDETIVRIFTGKENFVWALSGSGDIYRILSRHYAEYKPGIEPFASISGSGSQECNTIYELHDGSVLVGSNQGIFKLDKGLRKTIHTGFRKPVIRIYEDEQFRIFVGTSSEGLFSVTPVNEDPVRLSESALQLPGVSMPDRRVITVAGIGNRFIVCATEKSIFLAGKNKETVDFQKTEGIEGMENVGSISTAYVDRTQNIWIGGSRGLFKLKRSALFTRWVNVSDKNRDYVTELETDRGNGVWIGTSSSGLLHYDPVKKQLTKTRLPVSNVRAVSNATNGNIMVAGQRKIFQVQSHPSKTGDTFELLRTSSMQFTDMLEVNPGEWWLGSWRDGLYRFTETGKQDSLEIFNAARDKVGGSVPVSCLLKDSRQRIWVGTRGNGFFCVDPFDKTIRHFTRKAKERNRSSRIICMLEDSKKRLWIGTRGDGLLMIKPDQNDFEVFTTQEGLPSNSISSLSENADGEVWISTLNGASRFQPGQKMPFQSFGTEDGIANPEFSFNSASADKNGHVFFGNGAGIYMLKKNNIPGIAVFPVNFTGFDVFDEKSGNQLKKDSAAHAIDLILRDSRAISLEDGRNSFGIGFAMLDFTSPDKNRYLYRLKGYDSAWKTLVGSKAYVSYFEVPAGEYTFEVYGSNSLGQWTEKAAVISLRINPVFWLSGPAYIIYAVLILMMIGTALHFMRRWYRLRKLLQQEKDLAQKQSQQMVLYGDLSHEIRNRLSLILGPLELALSDKKVNTAILNSLYDQALRLKKLSDQILDIRKTDAGAFKLSVAEENIQRLAGRLFAESEPLAILKDLDYRMRSMKESIGGWCDEELLEIILMNVISNAIKYAEAGGFVYLKMDLEYLGGKDLPAPHAMEGNYLVLCVENSGPGISPEEIEKITGPFYRARNAYTAEAATGSGIGLNLAARLIALHHGIMEVMSEPGVSTRVNIYLPIDKYRYSISELKPNMVSAPIVLPADESGTAGNVSKRNKADNPETGTRYKVLVVDDEPELAKLVLRSLEEEFEVVLAGNGEEAWQVLDETEIDIVISDLSMPVMDGITLCNRMKENQALSRIPFIILTGRNSEQQKLICFQNGADDFMEKPFSPELLRWKVKSMLRNIELNRSVKPAIEITPSAELSESPEEAFIQKIVNIIEDNISNESLDVDFLAEENFMSRATFYRKMERLVGESPSVFIRKYRLKKAAMLLRNGLSVSAVAGKTGFRDPKYFSKCFQKEYGVLPSQYQQADA